MKEEAREFLLYSKKEIEIIKLILSQTNDEVALNMVAYHLSQVFEKLLKYNLNINGVRYPRTTRIDELIAVHKDKGVPYPSELNVWCSSLNEWTSARYNIDRYLSLSVLQDIIKLANNWVVQIDTEFSK